MRFLLTTHYLPLTTHYSLQARLHELAFLTTVKKAGIVLAAPKASKARRITIAEERSALQVTIGSRRLP